MYDSNRATNTAALSGDEVAHAPMVSCDMSGRTITATRTGCTSGAIVVISTAHFVSFRASQVGCGGTLGLR
jgi:hypothetical protein